jgi:hypothetical protein
MGKKRAKRPPAPPAGRRWVWAVAAAGLLVGVAAFWWVSEAQKPSAGTPRLAVDRTEVDLGDFPFDKMARAVFTLTNAGDSPLKVLDVSPVRALQGC